MTISFVSIFTYRLDFGKQKYVTAGSASIRNRGDSYLIQKYSDFSYKIQDSGLSVFSVLLDVRILDILEEIKQHFVEESEALDV